MATRPPPDGLSHETWWQLIKLARVQQARPLPLANPRGRPFTFEREAVVVGRGEERANPAATRAASMFAGSSLGGRTRSPAMISRPS